ncbi:hypothetical protein HKD37_10G027523 [Glycine soja]|nr:hypothetical protein JHK87_027000 [Glycine soja]
MKGGKKNRKIPATLFKPVILKPVPIYTLGEKNQKGYHRACIDFSLGSEKPIVAVDSGKASDAVEAEARNSSVGENDRLKKPFVPSFIIDNTGDPHETYIACCSKRNSQDIPFTLDNADKDKEESRQITSMQINKEEKNKELCDPIVEFAAVSSTFKENHKPDKGSSHGIDLNKPSQLKPRRRKHRLKVIEEDKPQRTEKPVTPKSVQSKENPTHKRKYERRKGVNKTSAPPREVPGELIKETMPESAQTSCPGYVNFDERARVRSYAVEDNPTVHLGSEIGVVRQEMKVGLACDLNASMKPKENPTGKRKHLRWKGVNKTSAPPTEMIGTKKKMRESAQTSCKGSVKFDERARDQSYAVKENPALEENPNVKTKYMGRKQVNKTSAPPTEVTGELTKEKMPESSQMSCTGSVNFDERTRDQSNVVKKNQSVLLGSEIGVVIQEMNVGFVCDLITSLKLEENPTAKMKCMRRKRVNKTSAPPTEIIGTKQKMPESAQTSCTGSVNFDERARDQSYPVKVNPTAVAWMKKALNNSMSLSEETQHPSTPIPPTEMTGKRNNARKKGLNPSPNMSWRRSLNFDMGTRNESYVGREILDFHIGKENMVLEETKVGLTYKDTWVKEALNVCMSLPEETQHPSTSISKCTSLGAKLNANSMENKNRKGQTTAQDGNFNNSQISTIRLQMDGSKRKHSRTFNCADYSRMNRIGAHYNGLPSCQTNFCIQFPNIQKKRRTEKGETSNTSVTSVTTTKEVQQTYPQEDALAHSYASSSGCWIYGSGYNAATVPAVSELTENLIDNTRTFNEFVLPLKRLAERSQSSTFDRGSLTRIRNCDTEPN